MTVYLVNAFSINMLEGSSDLTFGKISTETAYLFCKDALRDGVFINAIGHSTTDVLVRNMLNINGLPQGERVNVKLKDSNDELIVAQYSGPRLEEGTTELPEGATVEFWNVYFC